MREPIDPDEAARRCRCQDPAGRMWIYLNPFCRYADAHAPLADYGFTENSIMTSARGYHRAWLAGEYDDVIAPEQRPGYRPPAKHIQPEEVSSSVTETVETHSLPERFPQPLVHSVEVGLLQHFSKSGKTTKVEIDLRSWTSDEHTPKSPPGAIRALKILLAVPGLRTVVTYSRGYVPNADGSPARAPIWEKIDPTENDPRTRIKVGEEPPAPADSIRITVTHKVEGIAAYGHWIDAAPDTFAAMRDPASPARRAVETMTFNPWLERLKSW